MAATVETWDIRTMTRHQARAIGELVAATWPKPNVTADDRADVQLAWAAGFTGPDTQAPRAFVVRDGQRVIAHAGIFPRTIGTTNGDLTIAALARVCTAADARGRGLGEAVVRAAFEPVDAGSFDASLFQTGPRVQPFYEKLGAVRISNRIVNSLADDPHANPFWDEAILWYPAERPVPTGTIDIRGKGY